MSKIDLCIVNYNTCNQLERFIQHLYSDIDQFDKIYNIIVFDNASTDPTRNPESLSWFAKKVDTFILNEKNVGYAAACNTMARMSKSPILMLLNSDVWMTSENVHQIIQSFEDHPEMAIMAPKERDERGFITHAGITGTNVKPKMRGWKEPDRDDSKYRDFVECVTVTGSAYAIRRSVWNALANDPEYLSVFPDAGGAFFPTPHYYEETGCSYFARHRGYKIFYDGSISIGHSWHASSPVGGDADKLFEVSRKIFRSACDIFGIERD